MKVTAIIFIVISACLFAALVFAMRERIIKRLIRNKGKLRRELTAFVDAVKDISFGSTFGDAKLDVYLPKNACSALPVLLWVHGGGYIGGDKSGIEPWAHEIISRIDVAVVCVNYTLAPQMRYPIPLYQICEAIAYLSEHAHELSLDITRLFIGGDSAGAQIAAQYASLFYDEELRSGLKIPAAALKKLSGAILCCGFYDCRKAYSSRFPAIRTFLQAYTGQSRVNFPEEMDLFARLDRGYCASLVICGTRDPFFSQAVTLVKSLEGQKISAENFFPRAGHEFQFRINTKNSAAAADKVADFIRERTEMTDLFYDRELIDNAVGDTSATHLSDPQAFSEREQA